MTDLEMTWHLGHNRSDTISAYIAYRPSSAGGWSGGSGSSCVMDVTLATVHCDLYCSRVAE